jgi:hypothetical protein
MTIIKENILRKKLEKLEIKQASELFEEIEDDKLLILSNGKIHIWNKVPFINIKEMTLINEDVNNNYFEYVYTRDGNSKVAIYVNSRTVFLYYMQKISMGGSEIFITTSQKEIKTSRLDKEVKMKFKSIEFEPFIEFINLSLPLEIKLNNTYTFGKHTHSASTYKDAFLSLDDVQRTSNDVNKRKKSHEVSIQILLKMIEEMEQNIPGEIDNDLY